MFGAVRLRLILLVVSVLAVVLLATGALVYTLLSRQLDAVVDAELRATAGTGFIGGARPVDGFSSSDSSVAEDGVFQVRLIAESAATSWRRGPRPAESGDGWREVARTGPVPAGVPVESAIEAAARGEDSLDTVALDGQRYRLLTRVAGPDGRSFMATQAGVSLAARDRQQRIVVLALAGGGGLGLILTVIGAFLVTGRALLPMRLAFDRQHRFIADASHELRTPLALLRLEAEELGAGQGDGAAARPLVRQVDRLSRLLDGMLALARLDEGAAQPRREPVHAETLLRVAAAQAERLAAPGVHVTAGAAPDLWLAGDPDVLGQLLLILVDNACRVTSPGGRIALTATRDASRALLSVEDTGPGIPAEQLLRIFDRFYRVDKARARASGGAGLGLSIAREIVMVHGGEIWIESREGEGTRAMVRLAVALTPDPSPAARERGA